MKRLTKYEPCEGGIPLVTVEDEQSALQRLAAYEDAEEQGLLVRLPCKVGDTVWFWCGDTVFIKDKPFSLHSGVITKLKCVCFANGKMVFLSDIEYDIKDPYHENKTKKSEAMCSLGEYGDWLRFYLTREEAEAALKEESKEAEVALAKED